MNNKIVYSTNNLKKLREKQEKSIGLGTNFDISINVNTIQDSLPDQPDPQKTLSSKNFEDISEENFYSNNKSKEKFPLNPLKKIIFKKDIATTETETFSSKNSEAKNIQKKKRKKNLKIKNIKQMEINANFEDKFIKTTRSTFSNNNKNFTKKNKNVKIKTTTESSDFQNTLMIKPKIGSFKFYIDSETQLINNLNNNNLNLQNLQQIDNGKYLSNKDLNFEIIKGNSNNNLMTNPNFMNNNNNINKN